MPDCAPTAGTGASSCTVVPAVSILLVYINTLIVDAGAAPHAYLLHGTTHQIGLGVAHLVGENLLLVVLMSFHVLSSGARVSAHYPSANHIADISRRRHGKYGNKDLAPSGNVRSQFRKCLAATTMMNLLVPSPLIPCCHSCLNTRDWVGYGGHATKRGLQSTDSVAAQLPWSASYISNWRRDEPNDWMHPVRGRCKDGRECAPCSCSRADKPGRA